MQQDPYFKDIMFRHEEDNIPGSQGSQLNSLESPIKQETQPECFKEVETKIPFCCSVNIPHGFQYVPNETPKIVYNLDCVSVVTERCRKTIQVDGCGPVEVTFNLLKVVGCISYIANATVEGDCGHNCDYDGQKKHYINVCCSDVICVDNVLKCSIACLPHYEINCHNVVISDFQVKPVHDHGCNLLHFTGHFEFKHIPHS